MSNAMITIKHFLIECRVFRSYQKRLFIANDMKDIFENVYIDRILSFLIEIKL